MVVTVEPTTTVDALVAANRQRTGRVEQLGELLREQAAHLAAAEYRWLVLLEEFDRQEGWADQGARCCTHWLSWACGLSPVAARERLRVAHALAGLPAVSNAFRTGRLSYSKVRAITRIATPDNEGLLVTYGLHATAAQLERVVRDHRRVRDADDPSAAQAAFERRALGSRDHDDGTTSITVRLPTDVASEVLTIIDAVANRLATDHTGQPGEPGAGAVGGDGEDTPTTTPAWERPPPVATRRADALLALCQTAQAHGPTPVGGTDRYLVVVHTRHDALPAEHTPEPAAGRDAPTWPAAQPDHPASSATGRDAPTSTCGQPSTPASDPPRRFGPTGPLPPTTAAPAQGRLPRMPYPDGLHDPDGWLERGGALSSATARMLACDSSIVWLVEDAHATPMGITEKTRTVPRPLRRAVANRDRCCRFPGCTSRFVDVHHVWRWANNGPHALWNLLLLCRFHHRLVHHTGFEVYAYGDQTFSFHRPDGSVIPQSLDLPHSHDTDVERRNRAAGLDIHADTATPDWDGTPPDYDAAAADLQRASHTGAHCRDLPDSHHTHSVSAETPGASASSNPVSEAGSGSGQRVRG